MKTITHIIKTSMKYCPVCSEIHNVATVALKEKSIVNGVEIDYPSIYDYCLHERELILNEAYAKSNQDEIQKAYAHRTTHTV